LRFGGGWLLQSSTEKSLHLKFLVNPAEDVLGITKSKAESWAKQCRMEVEKPNYTGIYSTIFGEEPVNIQHQANYSGEHASWGFFLEDPS
jgi:hypothetical protein